jgi:ABC-type dipeptide/oligopeptide/nickel transport system permease component
MQIGYDAPPDEMDQLAARQRDGARTRREPISTEHRSAARSTELLLAAWTITSLLGIVLGLLLAKYGQLWGDDLLHPSTFVGTAIIGVSVAITLVAIVRQAQSAAQDSPSGRRAGLLVWLSLLLVLAVAWSALSIVWLAGWELPPGRPR